MHVIAPLTIAGWTEPVLPEVQAAALDALERGQVLYAQGLRFALEPQEQVLLSPRLSNGKSKNISYDPATGAVQGAASDADLLAAMMKRFAAHGRALVTGLFPNYTAALTPARTSYRPHEIAGRAPGSWRKDDTRLHVDAFPSRPMNGRRILRVFSNIDPAGQPRLWRLGEPFGDFAPRFIGGVSRPSPLRARLLAALGVTKGPRSAYDHLMLGLHDAAKASADYQRTAPQMKMDFPAGATWICYSDQVLHAAYGGKFALEQTFHLDVAAMAAPERSPLMVLERLTGRRLV